MRDLPPKLLKIQKLNAVHLDHGRWARDIEPLIVLLERMLKDPERARVICSPPNAIAVLKGGINIENVKSLIADAADLAVCLNDPTVLTETKSLLPTDRQNINRLTLVETVKRTRYRLMIEKLGGDIADGCPGERVAQYLGDRQLEDRIRASRESFEEEKGEAIRTRGDLGDPNKWFKILTEEEGEARALLKRRIPGITIELGERVRLFEFIQAHLLRISNDDVKEVFDYLILKNFTTYPDMELKFRNVSDQLSADRMLEQIRETQPQYIFEILIIQTKEQRMQSRTILCPVRPPFPPEIQGIQRRKFQRKTAKSDGIQEYQS